MMKMSYLMNISVPVGVIFRLIPFQEPFSLNTSFGVNLSLGSALMGAITGWNGRMSGFTSLFTGGRSGVGQRVYRQPMAPIKHNCLVLTKHSKFTRLRCKLSTRSPECPIDSTFVSVLHLTI